jgi:hypothetical protein
MTDAAVGLELDLGKTFLEFKAGVEHHHQWLHERLKPRRATYRRISNSVAAAAGPLLIDLGGPPAGHIYAPQWVAIFADTPFGAVAAGGAVSAALFIGQSRGSSGANVAYSTDDVVAPGLLVPSILSVPDDVICLGGQHIFVVLSGTGLVAGTTNGYNVNCGLLQADDTPETMAWI